MTTPAATAAIPQAAASGPPGKGGAGSAFRETLWFKKGDVEHMIAEARAKMAAQGVRPGAVEGARWSRPKRSSRSRIATRTTARSPPRIARSSRCGPGARPRRCRRSSRAWSPATP